MISSDTKQHRCRQRLGKSITPFKIRNAGTGDIKTSSNAQNVQVNDGETIQIQSYDNRDTSGRYLYWVDIDNQNSELKKSSSFETLLHAVKRTFKTHSVVFRFN